ncbi:hypothetical protein HPB52_014036 [Rhipicephalus sanguineus]|uniref:Uncharacterized protein n=1 Tax=Rhipicephalus sanguineus TaxID=34632 RepID=A0A9D4PWH9_RHISA|nr:hypothetical protein HPB52_014036 [Rhipicephalus sanguineus]
MNSLTPNRRAAYVEQPKKLSPTFYRTARACTINPAPHQVCRNSWACRAKQKNHFDRVNYTKDLLLRWDRLNREVATTSAREMPHTPSSAAPRTDTPPPCGNGSKQTDEKLAGPVMLQDPSREQWLRQSTSITELPNTAAG